MRCWTTIFAVIAVAGLAGCDKGGGGGGGDDEGYAPGFAAGMLSEGFGEITPWESTLDEVASLFPESSYRVIRIESGPIYEGPVLTVYSRGDGSTLPLGAYVVSFSFALHSGALRLMRIELAQRPDNTTPVCDWLIETIGPMQGSEEGCIDEHIARGVRPNGALYCVGTADGERRVDMQCGRAREGYEHTLTVRTPNDE